MKVIAAVDRNWGIGCHNQLLVQIPDDMKFFREETMGKVVVMGRKTFESLPGGFLPGRTNVVLTRNKDYQVKNAILAHSSEELYDILETFAQDDVYVIGGESIYGQLLDRCDTALITKIDFAYEADAHFPNLEEKPEWKLVEESEEQTYFDLEYYFQKYVKRK